MKSLIKKLLGIIVVTTILFGGWRYWSSTHPEPEFGLDDLMTMLVTPRHAKLCLAAKADNWELAAFELKNLRQSLEYIAKSKPSYLGNNMRETMNILIEPQLSAMALPIANADRHGFIAAFAGLTKACNDCHVYLEHPFIRMNVIAALDECSEAMQNFRSEMQAPRR